MPTITLFIIGAITFNTVFTNYTFFTPDPCFLLLSYLQQIENKSFPLNKSGIEEQYRNFIVIVKDDNEIKC